ncbi:hypothetical protein [Bartonella australis]|uniref:hypothetical protein n=1 Tax=Bartonella australis TaxID=388640 RepID=UPI00034A57CB|nr:hypothetical protein [Bartonella australis]
MLKPGIDDGAPLMKAESTKGDLFLGDLLGGCISFLETRIIRPQFVTEKLIETVASFLTQFLDREVHWD